MSNPSFLTQPQITKVYQDAVLSLDPTIPVTVPGDWLFKANAIGTVGSGLSQDISIAQKQQFPQTAGGATLDSYLAALNQPPRAGTSPARGEIVFASVPSANYTVAQGQTFTSSAGINYTCSQTTLVTTSNYASKQIPVTCTQVGPGNSVPIGSILSTASPLANVSSFTVTAMADGIIQESDGECAGRIISALQNPQGGGNVTDFAQWALQTSGVIACPVFVKVLNGINAIYCVIMGGSGDPNIIVNNTSPPYSRGIPSLIPTVNTYIQSVRPINYTVIVTTSETFLIPHVITVTVTLVSGYTLNTTLPAYNLTVQQLIQREVRRGIVSIPPLGVNIDGEYVIPLSVVVQTLDNGLAASAVQTGVYGGILIDSEVVYNGEYQNITIPTIADNNIIDIENNYAKIIYDISYSNINVVLAT